MSGMNRGQQAATRVVGVISDTHGLLRPEVIMELTGSDLIIHAGDIGGPEILDRLRKIASVVAVRGNADRGPWAKTLPTADFLRGSPPRYLWRAYMSGIARRQRERSSRTASRCQRKRWSASLSTCREAARDVTV